MLRLLSTKVHGCKISLKTIQTLSCWYSLECSRWELSDEFHVTGFQSFFRYLASIVFVLAKLATSSIRVKLFISQVGNQRFWWCRIFFFWFRFIDIPTSSCRRKSKILMMSYFLFLISLYRHTNIFLCIGIQTHELSWQLGYELWPYGPCQKVVKKGTPFKPGIWRNATTSLADAWKYPVDR